MKDFEEEIFDNDEIINNVIKEIKTLIKEDKCKIDSFEDF